MPIHSMPKRPASTTPLVPSALLVLALALPLAANAQRTRLVLVPEVPFASTFASGLSDAGHLVGTRFGGGTGTAFLFHRGVFSDLHPVGAELSSANAVNRLGEVAGQARTGALGTHAALWDASRSYQALPGGEASGINDAGIVVGNTFPHGFRWSAAAGLSLLPGLEGSPSAASAVNASGVAVGTSRTAAGDRATLWGDDLSAVDILPGIEARAAAINAQGWVVGHSGMGGFLWTQAQGTSVLDGFAAPSGINSAGQVVGLGEELQSALLWNPHTGQTHSLAPFAQAGADFTNASAINRHAQVAVTQRTETVSRAGILTLHPDWDGASGNWRDGNRWNWAGTGVANADIGRMHEVHVAPTEAATVTLDGVAEVGTLRVANAATLRLVAGALQAETEMSFEAGSRLAGSGELSAPNLRFLRGSTVRLNAEDTVFLNGAVSMDETVLVLQLGARMVFDGDTQLRLPRIEFELGGVAPEAGMRFDLLDWTGSLSLENGAWSGSLPLLPPGLDWDIRSLWVDGSVSFQAAIPEPATWALLVLGMVVLMRRRLDAR